MLNPKVRRIALLEFGSFDNGFNSCALAFETLNRRITHCRGHTVLKKGLNRPETGSRKLDANDTKFSHSLGDPKSDELLSGILL